MHLPLKMLFRTLNPKYKWNFQWKFSQTISNRNKAKLIYHSELRKHQNKVLIERFSNLYLYNKHHRWGVSSNIYRMFPSNHKKSTSRNKIPPRMIFEFVSGKTNTTIEVSRQIYTEYSQRTISTTGIRIYIWKRPPMLRVLRQIYTEYYHRTINVTSHGLRHWQRNTAPSLTNKST